MSSVQLRLRLRMEALPAASAVDEPHLLNPRHRRRECAARHPLPCRGLPQPRLPAARRRSAQIKICFVRRMLPLNTLILFLSAGNRKVPLIQTHFVLIKTKIVIHNLSWPMKTCCSSPSVKPRSLLNADSTAASMFVSLPLSLFLSLSLLIII